MVLVSCVKKSRVKYNHLMTHDVAQSCVTVE